MEPLLEQGLSVTVGFLEKIKNDIPNGLFKGSVDYQVEMDSKLFDSFDHSSSKRDEELDRYPVGFTADNDVSAELLRLPNVEQQLVQVTEHDCLSDP